jgi:hypothetical protein
LDNPFKKLKEEFIVQRLLDEGFEEVDGPLQCQTKDCKETVMTGLYNETAKVVTWKCSNGHVSRLENFVA